MLPKRHCESTGLNSFTATPVEQGSTFLTGLAAEMDRLGAAGQDVLLAVSGGADSMAMLHGLVEIGRPASRGRIAVAHLNHGLGARKVMKMHDSWKKRAPHWGSSASWSHSFRDRWTSILTGKPARGRTESSLRIACAAELRSLSIVLTAHQQDQTETLVFNILAAQACEGFAESRKFVI